MDSHVETELLAYLDGELGAQERAWVEAHLAQCADCAAELERLQALQQGLDATFDAALAPVRLPAAADARIREHLQKRLRAQTEPRPWLALWRRRGLIAQALLAVLVLFFTLNVTQVLRAPPPAPPQETLVLGQDKLSPGSKAALRVIVRSAKEAEPIAGADVVVRVGRAPGLASVVYTGRTDASGTVDVAFTVPEDLEGQASLVVETSSDGTQNRIVRPITIARDYKLFLSSDKPAYRPGQTIHLRALALDAVDLKPVEEKVAFALVAPEGQQLARDEVNGSEFGIAAFDFDLPPDAVHGQYTLRAALGSTASERTVTVGDYELPLFRVTVETDRDFYAPGDQVTGSVLAEYFFGKPVTDAQVTLRGYTQEPSDISTMPPDVIVQGQTDAEGRLIFAFPLPGWFGQSATEQPVVLDLEAEVIDVAGQRSGIRNLLPVAAQSILISAIPESGLLKPGFENVIFVMTAYPDGRPAETALSIEVGGKTYTLVTTPYGLAEFRHTPTGAITQLEVQAEDAQGAQGRATFTFSNDTAPQALLLRADRAAYEVGDTLRLEALVGGTAERMPQTIYLDVVRARQTIATLASSVEGGQAHFALDLDGSMVGTLELHAYYVRPDGSLMQDTRLVIVDAPRQVAVAVSADQTAYRPGETAHVEIRTTLTSTKQPTGQPIQAALGIGVVDESVYALETLPPGFVRAYFLLERELLERRGRGLDVPTLLETEAEEEIRAAQETAAKAAWAGAQGTSFSLFAESTAEPERGQTARLILTNQLGLLLAVIPLLLSAVVAQGLGITGVLEQALRRVGIGMLMFFVASPLIALLAGSVMWLLWMALGIGAPVIILLIVIVLLTGIIVHGWARRDARLQLATGLLAAYLVLGGLLVTLAARGGDLVRPLLALVVATFLLAVAAVATLGQGLVLEGWRLPGWATTLLALLLVPLVIYLSLAPGLTSDLTRALGNPALYAGPLGWLTGCAPAATATPEAVKATAAPTKVPEATAAPTEEPSPPEPEPTEAPMATTTPAAPTEIPTPGPTEPLPTPVPGPTPTPPPTTTPAPIEPFPLRQIFPETLHWNAEALTDESGRFAFDLPLADAMTTWRLTALASTRDGELGVATYDLLVFQDFFAELDLPQTIVQGQAVTATVTLYSFLPQAQTVRVEIAPAGWYDLISAPQQTITLPPDSIATATFVIRAAQAGDFSLQVTAVGEAMSDAIARDITVEP